MKWPGRLSREALRPALVRSTAASRIVHGQRRDLAANNHHLRGEP